MNICYQRVVLFLIGILACWSTVGETHGAGGNRFDVRGTVVDTAGRGVDAVVVLIDTRRDEAIDWVRPEHHPRALVTRADLRGVFVLAGVPAGSYALYARGSDGEGYMRRIGFGEPPDPYDIELSWTEIEGTLYWPDGRTPVADAIVGLNYDHYVTHTNEHGKFRFPGIEPTSYDVIARTRVPMTPRQAAAVEAHAKKTGHRSMADGFARPFEEIVVEAKVTVEPDEAMTVTMQLPAGAVQGVVTTDAGTPAVGARVRGGKRGDITDHAGRFELTYVPLGRCILTVSGSNREFGRATVEVAPGDDPTHAELTLYSFRPQVVFRFVTPDGDVLANERLTYAHRQSSWSGGGGWKTDDNGEWRDHLMYAGSRHYVFFSTTFGYAEQAVVIGEGVPEVHHEITLMHGGSICGVVRDQLTGAPLGGVVLRPLQVGADGMGDPESMWNRLLRGSIHNRLVSGYPITQVSRDGDGAFCFKGLPAGTYGLYVSGVGFAEQLTLQEAEQVSGVEIVVETTLAQRWIVGRVVGPNNAPVANTEVTIIVDGGGDGFRPLGPLDGVPRRVVTDDVGRFHLGPLHAGKYLLSAWTPGHRSESKPADVSTESLDVGDLRLVPVKSW